MNPRRRRLNRHRRADRDKALAMGFTVSQWAHGIRAQRLLPPVRLRMSPEGRLKSFSVGGGLWL